MDFHLPSLITGGYLPLESGDHIYTHGTKFKNLQRHRLESYTMILGGLCFFFFLVAFDSNCICQQLECNLPNNQSLGTWWDWKPSREGWWAVFDYSHLILWRSPKIRVPPNHQLKLRPLYIVLQSMVLRMLQFSETSIFDNWNDYPKDKHRMSHPFDNHSLSYQHYTVSYHILTTKYYNYSTSIRDS